MTDDSGMMSVDFLVGFTIFMLSFIWVATMVPGLFIGLQSHSLDFDAVAYRTGVILTEDPGAADTTFGDVPWEMQPDKQDIFRFGLAVSKETPHILDDRKVKRFFCSTEFSYPDEYRERMIFGDYPYQFNITLREAGQDTIQSVGQIIPENYAYGYIRRDVKIKSGSNTTIGDRIINSFGYRNADNVTLNEFRIQINNTYLLRDRVNSMENRPWDTAYRINPKRDRIMINFTNLEGTLSPQHTFPPNSIILKQVKIFHTEFNDPLLYGDTIQSAYENFTYVNSSGYGYKPPVRLEDYNVSLMFEPGFFANSADDGSIYVNLTFEIDPPQPFLNNTRTRPFNYNYHPANVTQPALRDAVLEVAVW